MTDEQSRQLNELYSYLLAPRGPNQPSRAEEIDAALSGIRSGKLTARTFLWLCGVIVAVGAAWTQLKGLGQ